MRLHLNKTLRAALIAAVSVVGFTITQAQAKVSTLTAQNAAGWTVLQDNAWVNSDSFSWTTSTNFQITSDGSPISFTANNAANSYGTYTFAVTLDLSKLSVDSDTILLRGGGLSGIGVQKDSNKLTESWTAAQPTWGVQNYVLPSEGTVTIVHTEGSGGGFVAVYSEDGTTVKFARSGAGGLRGSGDLVQTFYADQSLVNAATAIAVWETNGTMDATQMQNAAKALVDFPLYPPTDYTWAATGESATWDITSTVWNTSEKPGTNYVSAVTSSAIFNEGEWAKDVTVSGTLKADKVKVNDNYKFTIENGSSLTLDALTVANGMTATVAGAGSITLNSLSGALVIEAGATVNMPTTVTLDDTHPLPVSGEGTFGVTTLKVAGGTHNITNSLVVTGGDNGEGGTNNKLGLNFSGANGTLNLNAGTTTVTGAVYSNQGGTKINIGTGEKEATLVARRIELSDGGSSALHIGAKGKVVITSTNDTNGSTGAYKTTGLLLSEWVGGTTANIEGKLYAQSVGLYTGDAAMTLNVNNGGVVAVKGIATNLASSGHTSSSTINLAEGGKIVLGASGMVDCTIAPWTINLNGGEIGITADATLARAMNVAGDVTFNTAKYKWADSGATLNEGEDGGVMTISGNLTGTGTITKTGAGELILSGAGNALTHTLQVEEGKLTISGSIAIDYLEDGELAEGFVNASDVKTDHGNGFSYKSGVMNVYSVEEGAQLVNNGSFTINGVAVDVTPEGKYELSETVDHTTLWVNENSETFSDYKAKAGDALTKVNLAAGTSVTMDVDAASITLTLGGSATVNTTAATTVSSLVGTSAGSTLTLDGSDVLTISGGNAAFVSNVTIDGGTVKIGDQKALGEHNNGASQAKTITIAEGGTLDLNGIGDANFTYTMAGGKLTNTGNALGTNLSQTVGITLTENSTVEALADKQFWLRARGSNATTLNLGDKTLVKTGAGMFGVYKSTVTAGTIEVQDGEFRFESGCSIAADIILKGGTISGETAVSDDIDITAEQASSIGSFTLSVDEGKTVTLVADADLTFTNDLALKAGAVAVAGTLDVQGNIDLSKSGASTGKLTLKAGSETTAAGMWMASTASLLLENGAVLNIGGLEIKGTGEGSITTAAENEKYGTDKEVFSITNATVTSTGTNVTLGNTLSGVDVFVAEGSSLTLNTNADSVTVRNGGTFTKGSSADVGSITVEANGTVAGVEMDEVTINEGATATFSEKSSVSGTLEEAVYMYSIQSPITIHNVGEEAAEYTGLHQEGMEVIAETLASAANGVTVENTVAVGTIQHQGAGSLTLAHVNAELLDAVEVTNGSLIMQDVEATILSSMEIASGTTVAVYTDATAEAEGTVTITETLTAGGGTLLANLEMADGSKLDVNGGDAMALTLGSEFNLAEGAIVTLDEETLAAIAGLVNIGDKVILVKQYQDHALTTNLEDGDWSRTHFDLSSITNADYKLYVQDGQIGLVKSSNVPEPTTGTLSLLALMALAARRRRH